MNNSETTNFQPARNLSELIDYKVLDHTGDKVGTVDSIWEDHTGEPAYLAVSTGWLGFGKAHIVPARAAMVNETKRAIKLPYSAEKIKNAPSFDSQYDFTEDSETTLSSYYSDESVLSDEPATSRDALTSSPSAASNKRPDEARVQLRSEELKVGKREVEYGGVRLRKIVRTEVVNQPVELSREEIVIERVPASGAAATTAGDVSFEDQELYIPLRREEAVVQKTVRANEEVKVSKRVETERENVQETLRREDVEIEQTGEKAGRTRNKKL